MKDGSVPSFQKVLCVVVRLMLKSRISKFPPATVVYLMTTCTGPLVEQS